MSSWLWEVGLHDEQEPPHCSPSQADMRARGEALFYSSHQPPHLNTGSFVYLTYIKGMGDNLMEIVASPDILSNMPNIGPYQIGKLNENHPMSFLKKAMELVF